MNPSRQWLPTDGKLTKPKEKDNIMPDIYDQEIERLSKFYYDGGDTFKKAISDAWMWYDSDNVDLHSPLFDACTADRRNSECKCLTQIKGAGYWDNFTPLFLEIHDDPRIPNYPTEVKHPDELQVFAEWQRRLDKEIPNREPPVAPIISQETN